MRSWRRWTSLRTVLKEEVVRRMQQLRRLQQWRSKITWLMSRCMLWLLFVWPQSVRLLLKCFQCLASDLTWDLPAPWPVPGSPRTRRRGPWPDWHWSWDWSRGPQRQTDQSPPGRCWTRRWGTWSSSSLCWSVCLLQSPCSWATMKDSLKLAFLQCFGFIS